MSEKHNIVLLGLIGLGLVLSQALGKEPNPGLRRHREPHQLGRSLYLMSTEPNTFSHSGFKEREGFKPAGDVVLEHQTVTNKVAPRSWKSRSGELAPQGDGDGPGCEIDPASPAIGADIPLTYFGPAPSTVNPSFIGPRQLLTSGELDEFQGTITLPLYRGVMRRSRRNVWYILTDTTDQGNAEALGLNFSAKLNYAATGRGVRYATLEQGGLLVFDRGTVDFTPVREVVPGDDAPFPPAVANPGSIGDQYYTPLVEIVNAGGHVYNAPVIAFDVTAEQIDFPNGNPDYSLVHDKVVAIDMENETVTIGLTPGFSFARPVLYISSEASDIGVAALEGATYTPGFQDIEVGNDDSAFSAVERIFVTINGPEGCENPQRQGLNAALLNGRSPLNVLGGIPTLATDYSPLWDVNLGEWTEEAIAQGYRSRLLGEFHVLGFVDEGFITGPGGADYGSVGVIVNCPIVFRFL